MGLASATPQGQWIDEEFYPRLCRLSEVYQTWVNLGERTPAITIRLYTAEKDFKPAYRQFYISFLKSNPQVTNEDLIDMELPRRSHHERYRYTTVPGTFPHAGVTLPSPAIVEIHYRDRDSLLKARPRGVHGAEIRWVILDTPPIDWEELLHSSFSTRTPHRLIFENHQRGKALYFALRWKSTSGKSGPWSEIHHAIIP
jgi:hypothetical protein